MIILPGRQRGIQLALSLGAVVAVSLLGAQVYAGGEGARIQDRSTAIKNLGYDPIESPAVKWMPKPLPNPNAEAKTETQMKPYTETLKTDEVTFDMVPIKGGVFKMGSPDSEKHRKPDEGPQVTVTIEPFWMGKYEVTWDEYETWQFELDKERRKLKALPATKYDSIADAVARPTKPYTDMSFNMGKGRRPAISMTQYAARMYCKWLTAKTGRYYRLPTEAEWEYACRAGTTTAYFFGNDPAKLKKYAWYSENSNDKYQKVGLKKPNPWGLYDMYGNVAEWVLDQYIPDEYKRLGPTAKEPYAVPTKEYPRCVRGGSWQDDAEQCRSAARMGSSKDWKLQDPQIPQSIWYMTDAQFVGFRVVRPLRTPTAAESKLYEPDPAIYKEYVEAQGGKQ